MGTDTDWAYIAGLFDGEGHVKAQKYKRKDCSATKIVYGVHITNTNRDVLVWLCEAMGMGSIRSRGNRGNPAWKPSYVWGIQDLLGIELFLTNVEPYIKIKSSQVGIMLTLVRNRLEALGQIYHAPITGEDTILTDALAIVNKRGGN